MSGIFAVIGITSISAALFVLGRLSRRMGQVTRTGPYYLGFYLAALLVAVGAIVRFINLRQLALIDDLHNNILWVLLYNGAPAVGVTIGVVVAWRYWSWLLAERGW